MGLGISHPMIRSSRNSLCSTVMSLAPNPSFVASKNAASVAAVPGAENARF
jgi:hypothetical protein